MTVRSLIGAALTVAFAAASAESLGASDSRGELLYSTYCIGCHTTQVYWREKKLATDWISLDRQIRRWQSNVGLSLGDDDVAAIARYLNEHYYHFAGNETKKPGEAATAVHKTVTRRQGEALVSLFYAAEQIRFGL